MIGPPPDLPGLAPGGRPSPRAWGKFKRHFWGRSLRYQHGVPGFRQPRPGPTRDRLSTRRWHRRAAAPRPAPRARVGRLGHHPQQGALARVLSNLSSANGMRAIAPEGADGVASASSLPRYHRVRQAGATISHNHAFVFLACRFLLIWPNTRAAKTALHSVVDSVVGELCKRLQIWVRRTRSVQETSWAGESWDNRRFAGVGRANDMRTKGTPDATLEPWP
jgi:hypothetical protein